ncbi:MAG TPA: aldo/keto reductase [Thermoleophilaceae bacterium]|jgi:aryl-alcohol dehydrogenase-like predicted oxidoreductase
MTTLTADNVGTLALGGELEVRRLGFGAMRLTGDGIWGEPADREECQRVLRRALELGINLIDTADSYGPEVSENLIAETLHPYPDDLVIATKGGFLRDGPNQWRPDGRPEHLKQACEGSLQRLKLERIDVYQLHRPDPRVPYEESVGAIKELQDEGKIRLAGVSNVNLDQLATARSILDVVTVQNRYNLTDRNSEDVLDACEENGIGFIPWAPLDAGRSEVPHEIALAWLLQRSPVMLPIPGTSSVEHLEENVRAAEIDADTLAEAVSRIGL